MSGWSMEAVSSRLAKGPGGYPDAPRDGAVFEPRGGIPEMILDEPLSISGWQVRQLATASPRRGESGPYRSLQVLRQAERSKGRGSCWNSLSNLASSRAVFSAPKLRHADPAKGISRLCYTRRIRGNQTDKVRPLTLA